MELRKGLIPVPVSILDWTKSYCKDCLKAVVVQKEVDWVPQNVLQNIQGKLLDQQFQRPMLRRYFRFETYEKLVLKSPIELRGLLELKLEKLLQVKN
ncbi:hypothetical protein E2C01_011186 [Portunus trituberculatus]|uniref:Uncharacterized protein n=1 Tax=Portunus trituberculatus TaxID=210409 RepID=A0A5B7DAN4_PORTR|nr:hypothetical protein [Portunus trituberculatus]